jgi:imidazolonepropionase-like amidohydrolase
MRRKLSSLILLLLPFAPSAAARQGHSPQPPAVAFRNVTIVDVTAKDAKRALRKNQTVVFSGNRITAAGRRARIPAGATVVEASGKYLIPGLWDMHVHSMYEGRPEFFFPLLIANGVTGVREMASTFPLEKINSIRREISEGGTLGPRYGAVTGRIVEGPGRAGQAQPEFEYVATAEEARRLVRSRKMQGADFIKVYNWLPRDVYFAIADEAKKQGLPFAGHISIFVTAEEISDAGQKSVEHLSGVLLAVSSQGSELLKGIANSPSRPQFAQLEATVKAAETFDEGKAAALFARFKRNGTWQCPTYVLRRARAYISDPAIKNDPRLKYVPLSVRERWAKGYTSGDEASFRKVYLKDLGLAVAMQRAGVGVLAGTDTGFGNFYTIPGFSLHDELELLVGAGLTPLEALRAATLNPARFFNLEGSLGSIARGKLADLVLLDADPLEDVRNTRRISAVVANGRYLPRDVLDRMLADVEAAAGKK